MWALFPVASSIPQLRTLLEVQTVAFDHHNGKKWGSQTDLPILVKHPNDAVGEIEDISPVKIRHVG